MDRRHRLTALDERVMDLLMDGPAPLQEIRDCLHADTCAVRSSIRRLTLHGLIEHQTGHTFNGAAIVRYAMARTKREAVTT